MNSYTVCLAISLATFPICHAAQLEPGIPEVVSGTYYTLFTPLGSTENGFDFSIGFRLANGELSKPINYWVDKRTKTPTEGRSIADINTIIYQAFGLESVALDKKSVHSCIAGIRHFIMIQPLFAGHTGISLVFDDRRDLLFMTKRLTSAGLNAKSEQLIVTLADSFYEKIDLAAGTWSSRWNDIDSVGSVEEVLISGTVRPVRLEAVSRRLTFDVGTIDAALLKQSILFDPTLYK